MVGPLMIIQRIASWSGRITATTETLPFPEALPNDLLLLFGARVNGNWDLGSLYPTGFVGAAVYDGYSPNFVVYRVEEPTSSLALVAPEDALAVALLYRGATASDPPDAIGHWGTSGGSYPPTGQIPGRSIYSRDGTAVVIRSIAVDGLPADRTIVWSDGDIMTSVGQIDVTYTGATEEQRAGIDVRETVVYGDAEQQFWSISPYDELAPGAYNVGNYWTWCVVLVSNTLYLLPTDPDNSAPVGSGQIPIN